jgi:hypothetical protein
VTSQLALSFTFCSGAQRTKKNISNTIQSLMKWKVREESKIKMSGNKLVSPLKLFAKFHVWLQERNDYNQIKLFN